MRSSLANEVQDNKQPASALLGGDVSYILLHALILALGMLTAVHFRLGLGLGKDIGEGYSAHPPMMYVIILGSILFGFALSRAAEAFEQTAVYLNRDSQFGVLLVSLVVSSALLIILMPDVSQLQIVYYTTLSIGLGFLLILIPRRLRRNAYAQFNIIDNLQQIYRNRHMILLWLNHRIRARYEQTVLGILWIVLLPISESLVIAFAFTQLLGMRVSGDVSFFTFLFSGNVIFFIFRKSVTQGTNAITGMMGIIKQVYFPRETAIILILGEAIVDFMFMLVAFLLIDFFIYDVGLNIYYIFLPIPVVVMILLSFGVCSIVAWLGLIIRDMQQLVGVLMQLLFYSTVMFDTNRVNPRAQILLTINPLSALVEAFRDIVIYARMPNFIQLSYPITLSIALLYIGYVLFKVNEDRFVDFA